MADYEQGLIEILPLEGEDIPDIRLIATALPFKGVEFPTEQRIKTTYYPGNPVATQTVTGPIKPPSTFTGRWMDLNLGDGQARQLALSIEYLCERAIPVEVRWGGRSLGPFAPDDPQVVRRGLIKKFNPKYNRAQDIEWSIEFEWRGEAIQTKPPTFTSLIPIASDGFVDFSDLLSVTQDETQSWIDVAWALISAGANALRFISDAMDDVQNAIVDCINVIDGATAMLQQAAELPSDVMDRVQGLCDRVVLACQNGRAAHDAVCGLWPGLKGVFTGQDFIAAGEFFSLQAKRAQLALYPTDDPLAFLDGTTAESSLIHQWDAAAEQAASTAARLAATQVPDVIAIVRPPAGSDLRDLAAKYYTDPDLWEIIADYNGLDSSEVPATPTGPSDTGAPPIYVPQKYETALSQVWGDV